MKLSSFHHILDAGSHILENSWQAQIHAKEKKTNSPNNAYLYARRAARWGLATLKALEIENVQIEEFSK